MREPSCSGWASVSLFRVLVLHWLVSPAPTLWDWSAVLVLFLFRLLLWVTRCSSSVGEPLEFGTINLVVTMISGDHSLFSVSCWLLSSSTPSYSWVPKFSKWVRVQFTIPSPINAFWHPIYSFFIFPLIFVLHYIQHPIIPPSAMKRMYVWHNIRLIKIYSTKWKNNATRQIHLAICINSCKQLPW